MRFQKKKGAGGVFQPPLQTSEQHRVRGRLWVCPSYMFCCWFESWGKAMVNQGPGLTCCLLYFFQVEKTREGVTGRGPFPVPVSGAQEGQTRLGFNLHVSLQQPKKSPTPDDLLFIHMDNLHSYRSSTAVHQKFMVRAPNRTEC